MTKIKASGGKEGRDGGKKRGKEGAKKGGPREDGGREGGRGWEGRKRMCREGGRQEHLTKKAAHHAQDGGCLPQEQPPVRDISAQEARLQQTCKLRLHACGGVCVGFLAPSPSICASTRQSSTKHMCVHTYIHKYINN